ncbi:MAG: hypothetical protein ACYCWW_00080 [Deltaproteobacteria bacterium]
MMRHPIRRILVATSAVVLGCAHPAYGPSSDDRLAAEVQDSAQFSSKKSSDSVLPCADLDEALARSRNAERPESDRLRSYMQLYRELVGRTEANQKAFDRHPELLYGGGKGQAASEQARAASDKCQQMLADTRSEFDLLVRELFQPLVIMDISSGRKAKVPRISFNLLRSAIQELAPTDKDSMYEKIASAEKLVDRRR